MNSWCHSCSNSFEPSSLLLASRNIGEVYIMAWLDLSELVEIRFQSFCLCIRFVNKVLPLLLNLFLRVICHTGGGHISSKSQIFHISKPLTDKNYLLLYDISSSNLVRRYLLQKGGCKIKCPLGSRGLVCS